MGNTCKSMADSFQCMTKRTTIKKKLNKIIYNTEHGAAHLNQATVC